MRIRTSFSRLLTGALGIVFLLVLVANLPVFGDPSPRNPGMGFNSLSRPDSPGTAGSSSSGTGDQPVGRFVEPGSRTMTVVLDPGHGGRDRGVARNGRLEKDRTLAFARTLKRIMNRSFPALKPVLTRDQDEFLSLKSRTQKANEVGGDLFLSLHVNGRPSSRAAGLQLYTLSVRASGSSPRLPRIDTVHSLKYEGYTMDQLQVTDWIPRQFRSAFFTSESRRLARRLIRRLKTGDFQLARPHHRQAPLWVLKDALMPAVMIELGSLDSKGEQGMDQRGKTDRLAQTLATAINVFRKESDS